MVKYSHYLSLLGKFLPCHKNVGYTRFILIYIRHLRGFKNHNIMHSYVMQPCITKYASVVDHVE